MNSELVSSRVEPSSSRADGYHFRRAKWPLMRGSHVPDSESKEEWLAYKPPGSQIQNDAQADVGVDRRHRIVCHHAQAAVQRLEAARRERLDHVEDPEQHEADQRAREADRDERERDQHADDFVHAR